MCVRQWGGEVTTLRWMLELKGRGNRGDNGFFAGVVVTAGVKEGFVNAMKKSFRATAVFRSDLLRSAAVRSSSPTDNL